jgi:hypothetical protein
MFDHCWLWRRQLSRRADGTLSPTQWGALENHLARCERCQVAAQADLALRATLQTHTGMLDTRSAHRLDNHVIDAVFAGLPTPERAGRPRCRPFSIRRSDNTQPFLYFIQIIGGALVASAITALFLVPALHSDPQGIPTVTDSPLSQRTLAHSDRTEPPVPLSSLLQTTSPRAALLWALPQSARTRALLPPFTVYPGAPLAPPRPARSTTPGRQNPRDLPNILGS